MSHGAAGKADYAIPEDNVFIDSHSVIHFMSVNSARCEFDGRSKRTQFFKNWENHMRRTQ